MVRQNIILVLNLNINFKFHEELNYCLYQQNNGNWETIKRAALYGIIWDIIRINQRQKSIDERFLFVYYLLTILLQKLLELC